MGDSQDPLAAPLLSHLVKALLEVQITALGQADRMLALTILLQALQVCLNPLLAAHMLTVHPCMHGAVTIAQVPCQPCHALLSESVQRFKW